MNCSTLAMSGATGPLSASISSPASSWPSAQSRDAGLCQEDPTAANSAQRSHMLRLAPTKAESNIRISAARLRACYRQGRGAGRAFDDAATRRSAPQSRKETSNDKKIHENASVRALGATASNQFTQLGRLITQAKLCFAQQACKISKSVQRSSPLALSNAALQLRRLQLRAARSRDSGKYLARALEAPKWQELASPLATPNMSRATGLKMARSFT
jgi:hypothetical protein